MGGIAGRDGRSLVLSPWDWSRRTTTGWNWADRAWPYILEFCCWYGADNALATPNFDAIDWSFCQEEEWQGNRYLPISTHGRLLFATHNDRSRAYFKR